MTSDRHVELHFSFYPCRRDHVFICRRRGSEEARRWGGARLLLTLHGCWWLFLHCCIYCFPFLRGTFLFFGCLHLFLNGFGSLSRFFVCTQEAPWSTKLRVINQKQQFILTFWMFNLSFKNVSLCEKTQTISWNHQESFPRFESFCPNRHKDWTLQPEWRRTHRWFCFC